MSGVLELRSSIVIRERTDLACTRMSGLAGFGAVNPRAASARTT
jgi:hypothetical protein